MVFKHIEFRQGSEKIFGISRAHIQLHRLENRASIPNYSGPNAPCHGRTKMLVSVSESKAESRT